MSCSPAPRSSRRRTVGSACPRRSSLRRVAPARCRAGAPSEPDVRVVPASGSSKSLWASEGVGRGCWCCRCVRWHSASSALLPVGGQGRVVGGRVGLDLLVAADGGPGQACQAGAGVPVTEEPPVLSGGVKPPEVAVHDPSIRLRLVPVLGPL